MAMEELLDELNIMKELTREHSKWLLRYTKIHVPRHEELMPIIIVAKAYRKKVEKGKKVK